MRLLLEQPSIQLYAPQQAVSALREVTDEADLEVFNRVTAVELAYKDSPIQLVTEDLRIEAVRIPHSGWPSSRTNIENIAWRVTLDDTVTVLHMGDADPNDVHFARDADYWKRNKPQMAFPPYWFFSSSNGRSILQNRINAEHNVGVHVPTSIPGDPIRRPLELRSADLFTSPGETRLISPD